METAKKNTFVTVTPWIPKGYHAKTGQNSYSPVIMSLIDDSTLNQGTGSGGWQIVDRPKISAATQWYDFAPWQLSFSAYLDKSVTNPLSNTSAANSLSVEDYCAQLMSWVEPVPGALMPPLLKIVGNSLPLQSGSTQSIQYWVLYSVNFANAIRDATTGHRTLQQVDLVFYQYVPPLVDPQFMPALGPASIVNTSSNASTSSSNNPAHTSRKNVSVGVFKTMAAFCAHYHVSAKEVTQTNGNAVPASDYPILNKKFTTLQIPG